MTLFSLLIYFSLPTNSLISLVIKGKKTFLSHNSCKSFLFIFSFYLALSPSLLSPFPHLSLYTTTKPTSVLPLLVPFPLSTSEPFGFSLWLPFDRNCSLRLLMVPELPDGSVLFLVLDFCMAFHTKANQLLLEIMICLGFYVSTL